MSVHLQMMRYHSISVGFLKVEKGQISIQGLSTKIFNQHFLPGVPTQKDWSIACTNYDQLHVLKSSIYKDIGTTERTPQGRAPANIDAQVRAFRVAIRERKYL